LTSLPENFGISPNLITLDLANNFLTTLPESLIGFTNLTYLSLGNNQIPYLPDNFCELPVDWGGENDFGLNSFNID